MAAVTVATQTFDGWGERRVWVADLSGVADGSTWATGMQKIDQVVFTPQTAVAHGATVSGGTITFKVAAGTLAGKCVVVGT